MEPSSPPRRGTFDLPKPETGLAEWTSKIKALQQQVDADEEAEQRRLEEEIVAARRARLRRSRGAGNGSDRVDLSVSPSTLGLYSSRLNKSPSSEVLKSSSERRSDRDDALRRIEGNPIDTSSITQGILPRPGQFPATQHTPSKRPDPLSLASFIGGRATGPRLNRHAPQQDAHDPTHFEQRNISAPHPIFGKGGVAMPGLVTIPGMAMRDAVKAADAVERYQPRQLGKRSSTPLLATQVNDPPVSRSISPQKSGSRDRTVSTPSATASKYSEQVEHHPLSPQKSGNRERTLSTPGPSPSISRSTDAFSPVPTFPRTVIESKVPNAESRSRSPGKNRSSTSFRSTTPQKGLAEKPATPRQLSPVMNTPSSPATSLISTPSLARAIRPEPRSQTPVISVTPSPAFQKLPSQKDPTPSISRLQGRGFVQNMVRASTQLETSVKSVPNSPATRPNSGRKSSVLDRWQPNVQMASSPTQPPNPRLDSPARKALSDLSIKSDPPPMKPPVPAPTAPTTPSPSPAKALKLKTSHIHPDPLADPEPLSTRRAKMAEGILPHSGTPGLGSATTMVVYKPKTPEPSSSSGVDELGVRHDTSFDEKGRPRFSVPTEIPGPSGKPLNHPTKDRVRKPKKSSDVSLGLSLQLGSSDPVGNHEPPWKSTLPLRQLSPQPPRAPFSKVANEPSTPVLAESDLITAKPSVEREPAVQVTHKWSYGVPIGVKQVVSSQRPQSQAFQPEIKSKVDTNLLRRALPGIANTDNLHAPQMANELKVTSPESTLQVLNGSGPSTSEDGSPSSTSRYTGSTSSTEGQPRSPNSQKSDPPPPSSPKHARIPSTGNRALVMDIAQALNDYNTTLTNESVVPREEIKSPVAESAPEIAVRVRVAPSLERRRSSYDRFSAVSVMPPLKEEATPHGTPFGTLAQKPDTLSPETTLTEQHNDAEEKEQKDMVHLDISDTPLPLVDVPKLLQQRQIPSLASADTKTISVDTLVINGNSSITVTSDADIFYDSELLTIIHRYKSKSTGLVSTQLWVWHGRKSVVEEKEKRKVQELATRFHTSPAVIYQSSEPPSLVHFLGGTLIIRQGNRSHWSADNTTMFSIRNLGGVTFIDEHDFSVKNLCSAFSYCLTILDTVYLWHGCGSTDAERQAATQYASRILKGGSKAIQLYEGENDQDDLFWMALGDNEFAKADYWQWRRHASEVDPRIWRVDAKAVPPIVETQSLREGHNRDCSIHIIDCVWELFVKVGPTARGDRTSIQLALNVAKRFSEVSASSRPFTPTVHVLVLPSKLPSDLRLNLRELDDAEENNGEVPDHMNLLSSAQAQSHLHQRSWERPALRDETMLPLGVSALHVS